MSAISYTWQQKARVTVFGKAKLQLRQPQGFKTPTMFYLAKCETHGFYEDYLHGFEGEEYTSCPACNHKGAKK